MNKKDIQLINEAWGGSGEYQPKPRDNEYGPFTLSPNEQNVVDAFIGRTKLIDLLRVLKTQNEDLYYNIMEQIVLMNIKDPKGM